MGLLLAWCLASALWAPETSIVLRRAGLEVVVVVSLMLSVETIGPARAFTIWRWLLAAVLLVNFLSIPLIPAARHAAGEIDPALVGNWRGLYGHKNVAGAVCAMTAILFVFSKNGWRNWIGIAIALAACAFLAMTHSKSSAGFLVIALMAGILYRVGWRDGLCRAVLVALRGLPDRGAGGLCAAGCRRHRPRAGRPHRIHRPLRHLGGGTALYRRSPAAGRGLWHLHRHAHGQSPLHNYVSGSWVDAVSHGHNGYLQVLVTIGGIGFVLAMLALLAAPARRFWALDWKARAPSSPCCWPCSSSPFCTISWNRISWRATAPSGHRFCW